MKASLLIIGSLTATIAFVCGLATPTSAVSVQLTDSQKQQIRAYATHTSPSGNAKKAVASSQVSALMTSSYYFLVDPLTSLNGQTTTSSSIPFSYDVFSTNSNAQFRDFVFCPYNSTDAGDLEVLVGNCLRSTMPAFNNGTYYSGTLSGNATLIYPGINNLSCVVYSTSEDTFQDCTEFDASKVQRVTYTGSDFPVYRFWSDKYMGHFYTIDQTEKTRVTNTYDSYTWNYEKIAWTGARYTNGTCAWGTPVYRFWSDRYMGHFYTIDPVERDRVIATWPDVWTYEGPRYCASQTPSAGATKPVYRFWSDKYMGHFYTSDAAEKDRVVATWPDIWKYEGVKFYVK